jgi:mycothiol system anti-sigma-R factor
MSTLSNQGGRSSEAHFPCMEMLQLILDGEATPTQHREFKDHMDHCRPCFQNYSVEMKIKEMIKTSCCGQAPPDLIESIKKKISENPVQ